jgi:hypothetical protein
VSALAAIESIRRCPSGHDAETCADLGAGHFPRGRQGSKRNRLCPCHNDTKASLSWNPGTEGMWMVWNCGAKCDPAAIRAEALDLGIDPGCVGNYGLPKRAVVPGLRVAGYDAAMVAAAKRWHAVAKLPELNGSLVRMCIQAISEGDGNLPGDPLRLLPANQDDFLALASRAGLDSKYRYRVYKKWLSY